MTPEQRRTLEKWCREWLEATARHGQIADAALACQACLADNDRLKAENRYLLQGIERLTRDNDAFLAGQESERAGIASFAEACRFNCEQEMDEAGLDKDEHYWRGRALSMTILIEHIRNRGNATPTPLDEVLNRLEALEKACEPLVEVAERYDRQQSSPAPSNTPLMVTIEYLRALARTRGLEVKT